MGDIGEIARLRDEHGGRGRGGDGDVEAALGDHVELGGRLALRADHLALR